MSKIKLSTLIDALTRIEKEHGDMPVCLLVEDFTTDIDKLNVHDTGSGIELRICDAESAS